MRYFIEITYNGAAYCGWQIQPNAGTVQQVIEETMSTFFRQAIKVVGAGRTDAGVHAKQLFAHFDMEEMVSVQNAVFRLNMFLPTDIAIVGIHPVVSEAHARFHAVERAYEYKISTKKNPFSLGLAHTIQKMPDVALMNQAAQLLFDYKDFQCFSRSKTDVKTYNCYIKKALWEVTEEGLIFTIAADRFLRNMVRAIVGTMLDIGFGQTTLDEFKNIMEQKDRRNAGASAPACGLYLTKVVYPIGIFIEK